jgi:hypothetical protein
MNDINRDNTTSLESSLIPPDEIIYLPSPHKLLKPDELEIEKSYYVIDITNPENVNYGQIEIRNGIFYSSGPFQNYGELRKIEIKHDMGEYTYYTFQHGNTYHYNIPNPIYYYLYLDQTTINKPVEIPVEIPPENVFKISDDDEINLPFYETDVRLVGGKKRKTKKTKKTRKCTKPRRKTIRRKKKSRY